MDTIHHILNTILPPLALILSISLLPFYVAFRFFKYLKGTLCPENVAGKVVLITGAASGIGEHLAYEYARRGACLALVDIRADRLGVVASEARSLGSPDVICIGADVSNVEESRKFVEEAVDHFGKLNHLVNNAGIPMEGRFEKLSHLTDYNRVMDVNFWGTVYGTHFALPHLSKSSGRIIVIASSAGWFPLPRLCFYNASKAAVISFYETLRTEVGDRIGITIATPGFVKSEMTISPGYPSKSKAGFIPLVSTQRAAWAIVTSACRGDFNLTEPSWVGLLFPWKVLCPEFTEYANRWLFITFKMAMLGKNEAKSKSC